MENKLEKIKELIEDINGSCEYYLTNYEEENWNEDFMIDWLFSEIQDNINYNTNEIIKIISQENGGM
jgi:hypothetical protein